MKTTDETLVIEHFLHTLYVKIGIDKPSNHDDILAFCVNDIKATADIDFNDDDIRIAFRRFLELQNTNHETNW